MKTLALKLTGYTIKGVADVKIWGGGCIEMADFSVLKIKRIKEYLNDGGFGYEKINGAICHVYRNYEGTLVYSRTLYIGKISENTYANEF